MARMPDADEIHVIYFESVKKIEFQIVKLIEKQILSAANHGLSAIVAIDTVFFFLLFSSNVKYVHIICF